MSTDQAPCAPTPTCAGCPRAAINLMRMSTFWPAYGETLKEATLQELDDFTSMLSEIENADPRALVRMMKDIAQAERAQRGTGSTLLDQLRRHPPLLRHVTDSDPTQPT